MKKETNETKNIYVLVDERLQGSEIKDICVSFNENEIIEYQKRVGCETIIEKRDYDGGWCDGIKYMNLFLKEVDGILYVKRCVDRAEIERRDVLSSLVSTRDKVFELSRFAREEDIASYTIVVKDIERRFDSIKNSKLNISTM